MPPNSKYGAVGSKSIFNASVDVSHSMTDELIIKFNMTALGNDYSVVVKPGDWWELATVALVTVVRLYFSLW